MSTINLDEDEDVDEDNDKPSQPEVKAEPPQPLTADDLATLDTAISSDGDSGGGGGTSPDIEQGSNAGSSA